MFLNRLIVGLVELGLSLVLAVFVVYWSYETFVRLGEDYDVERELKNRNLAVAILLTSVMVATSLLMQQSVYPVTSLLTLYLTSPAKEGLGLGRLLGYCLGHLVLAFLFAVGTVRGSLKLFETLVVSMDEEEEIRRGNVAVAVVMAGVVLVMALYLQQGVSAVTKSLIPQPSLGQMRVLR